MTIFPMELPDGMKFFGSPDDEGQSWFDSLQGYAAGLTDQGMKGFTEAVGNMAPSVLEDVLLSQLDDIMDDAPGSGELFTWIPPHLDQSGKPVAREVDVKPMGWAVLAVIGGALALWMFKG